MSDRMTTNPNLDQAREWAKGAHPWDHPEAVATAKVIASLPDEWIDADKLRETIEFHRDRLPHGAEEDLEALLPAPQPRTLGDMTEEERQTCQWMQARDDVGNRVVITKLNEAEQEVTVLYENGGHYEWPYSVIVPLPDLRRMVWPEEQATEKATVPPLPEHVPVEEPWLVEFRGERYVGARDPYESPNWALAQMDGTEIYFADDYDVILVDRLVPEVKA